MASRTGSQTVKQAYMKEIDDTLTLKLRIETGQLSLPK